MTSFNPIKIIMVILIIEILEVLVFNQVLASVSLTNAFKPAPTLNLVGWWDIIGAIYYIGSMLFWLLSIPFAFIGVIVSMLYFSSIQFLNWFNGLLTFGLLISIAFFIRGSE
jgi:hypothetical protein